MSFQIVCSGPGPHDPPSGVLGTSTTQIADARCGSAACRPTPDPQIAIVGDLLAKARIGIAANNTFLALASPTNAQTVAQVQRLTRENNAIIKLLAGLVMGATDLLQDETGT